MPTLAVRASRLAPGWADIASALALAVLALAVRLPFQIGALLAWDSVLYARALEHFNVAEGSPHPPGYLFYVVTARAVSSLVGDANGSLVLVSVLGGALAVGLLALLGSRVTSRSVGLAAAALLATSPLFWFYSEVAYPYTVLASGAILLALLTWRTSRGQWPGPLVLGLALGLAGGFRLDLTLFLLPMVAWGVARRGAVKPQTTVRRAAYGLALRMAALSGAVAVGTAIWYLPTALLSNGLEDYTHALLNQADYVENNYSLATRGMAAVDQNGGQVINFTWQALGWALAAAGYGLLRGYRHPAAPWLVLWLAPPLAFYSLVHIGDRGYIFSYLPALCLLAGYGVMTLGQDVLARARRWLFVPSFLGLALGSVLTLGLGYAAAFHFLTDRGRHGVYELQCFGPTLHATTDEIRARFPPQETLLFSSFYYQHARYLLPEYQAWRFDPAREPTTERALPPGIEYVVAFGEDVGITPRSPNLEALPLPCGRRLYIYRVDDNGAYLAYRHKPPAMYVGK